jgi:hypothetical protein
MHKLILFILSVSNCLFAAAQNQDVLLQGKIGNYPINAELTVYDDTVCNIRYYYISQKKDIYLEGILQTNGIIKMNTRQFSPIIETEESMILKRTADGFSGTWSGGGKRLALSLKKISIDTYKNPFGNLPAIRKMKKENPYNYMKLADLVFIKDSISKTGRPTIQWIHEKYSGIPFIRLHAGYSKAVLQKINDQLLETHLIQSLNSLECSSGPGTEYYLSISRVFGHEHVFSFNTSVSYYCGGAHPDNGSTGYSFDVNTGAHLNLEDIFWFGGFKPPQENTSAWYTYRTEKFAPVIVELMKELYPEHMTPEDDVEGCDYTENEAWLFADWYFTPKGLYVGATFPRAMRACEEPEWSIIPYQYLKKYLSPETRFRLPD